MASSDGPVSLELPEVTLPGVLTVPADAWATVIFAHGSGSSHQSPRNRAVAETLNDCGLATLLFDLLTPGEAANRENVFDITLLGSRLADAVRWVTRRDRGQEIGLFGASTGGAAALWAAAELPEVVGAVVIRGGRPDLTGPRLERVRCPTLLIVGGADTVVLELNRAAAEHLHAVHGLQVIPGAGHLFERPNELSAVADLAGAWFADYLAAPG